MINFCGLIPTNAKKVIKERCRVVTICIFTTPSSRITREQICRQLQRAAEIWCKCRIVFRVSGFRRLDEVVPNPNDYTFMAEEIVSAKQVLDHPGAHNLFDLDACCSEGDHVNLYYTGGREFQSGESGVGVWELGSAGNTFFILMADGANSDNILAHELGHVLGLDHVEDTANLMYPRPPGTDLNSRQCETVSSSPLVREEFYETRFISSSCSKFEVTFLEMQVFYVSDEGFSDDLESTWTFDVNGQTGQWSHQNLEKGTHFLPQNLRFQVNNPAAINVIISGVDEDDLSANDTLPKTTRTFLLNEVGEHTIPAKPASNDEIQYKVKLRITCLEEEIVIPGICEEAIIKN